MDKATREQQVFIIGGQQLQNSLLCKLIEKETGISCSTLSHMPSEEITKNLDSVIILLDVSSVDAEQSLIAIHQERSDYNKVQVAFFNLANDEELTALAAHPCVSGAFNKDCPQDRLIVGINAILEGEIWLPRKILEQYLLKHRNFPKPGATLDSNLTDREIEVLKVMATGAKNTDIADQLNLSPHTIKTHIYNIFKKIKASNRLQAVNWAQDNLA